MSTGEGESDNAPPKSHVAFELDEDDGGRQPPVTISKSASSSLAHTAELKELLNIRRWTVSTFVYFIFVLLFTFVVFTQAADREYAFYLTNLLRDLFLDEEFPNLTIRKTYHDIGNIDEYWQFVLGPFISGAYPVYYTNGDLIPDEYRRNLLGVNTIQGLIRLRQVRVQENSCKIPSIFESTVTECNAVFRENVEDKTPIYKNTTYVDSSGSYAFAAITSYPASGYVVDLSKDREEAVATLERLKDVRWIDERTRAAILEFSVYNVALNLFTVARIVVEFPPTGGAVPYDSFKTVKLVWYSLDRDYYFLVLEIFLALFVLYYFFEELYEMHAACCTKNSPGWRSYVLQDYWNYFDMLNILVFIAVFTSRAISRTSAAKIFRSPDFLDGSHYVNLQDVAFLIVLDDYMNSCNMLLCWVKFFKFIQKMPRIGQLVKTLARSATDILLFIIMFFFVFFGFASCGFMMFSLDMREFRTITASMKTLGRMLLGDFNYESFERANRFLGPIFFFSYVLLATLVLLNMFIAIINGAYESIRREEDSRTRQANMEKRLQHFLYNVEYDESWVGQIKFYANLIFESFRVKAPSTDDILRDIVSGAADTDGDGLLSREELMAVGADADALLAEYDIDNSQGLDPAEILQWLDDLRTEKTRLEAELSSMLEAEAQLDISNSGREHVKHQRLMMRKKMHEKLMSYQGKVKARLNHQSTLLEFHYTENAPNLLSFLDEIEFGATQRDFPAAPNTATARETALNTALNAGGGTGLVALPPVVPSPSGASGQRALPQPRRLARLDTFTPTQGVGEGADRPPSPPGALLRDNLRKQATVVGTSSRTTVLATTPPAPTVLTTAGGRPIPRLNTFASLDPLNKLELSVSGGGGGGSSAAAGAAHAGGGARGGLRMGRRLSAETSESYRREDSETLSRIELLLQALTHRVANMDERLQRVESAVVGGGRGGGGAKAAITATAPTQAPAPALTAPLAKTAQPNSIIDGPNGRGGGSAASGTRGGGRGGRGGSTAVAARTEAASRAAAVTSHGQQGALGGPSQTEALSSAYSSASLSADE